MPFGNAESDQKESNRVNREHLPLPPVSWPGQAGHDTGVNSLPQDIIPFTRLP